MLNRVDEKGKVFTARVRKMEVEVHITTVQGQVHGFVHVQPGQRVKDLLNNHAEQFLAVTAATISDKGDPRSGSKAAPAQPPQPHQADFVAINKQFIISVVPVDEEHVERVRDEEYFIPH